ncbi:MAG: hypothetical protein WD602_04370 [Actinomycetota bacterium]
MKIWSAVTLVGLVATTAAAAGAPVRSSILAQVTGDEPEYLLTALSLAEDRSLDISNQIEQQRYREFHEVDLSPQARVLEDGRMVSPHDPLLPLVLALPMAMGGYLFAKLTISLMAGVLAGLLVWLAVRRFEVGVLPAALTVGIFGTSAPVAIYGSQVYPEMAAALALAVTVGGLSGPLRARGLGAVVAGVVALSWLGTKYIPVAAVAAAIALIRLWKGGRRRELALVTAGFSVCAVLYFAGHLLWYGALTVYATGQHFSQTGQFSVVGVSPDYLSRASRLIGLLVDGRFGLAAWQPAWLLTVPAIAALATVRPRNWTVLFAPMLTGWLMATFPALTMHGFWSPGRQVVVVLPLAVLAIAWWVGRSRKSLAALIGLGAAGVLNLGWLFWEGHTAGMTLAVHFQDTSSPVYRGLSTILPHYMVDSPRTWILHGAWAAAALIVGALAVRRARHPAARTLGTSSTPA